jgi:hypothetical protein
MHDSHLSMKRIIYVVLLAFLVPNISFSQKCLEYSIATMGVASDGDFSPFWFTTNRHGISSIDNKWAYMRGALSGAASLNGDWAVCYGADVVGGKNMTSDVYIHQAYADVSWRWLRLSVGKKERGGELKNFNLSTGGLVESGNAAPIPQVRLDVPEYKDFFGTNGWFALRGHVAYGWFDDGNWQQRWAADGVRYGKNILYHSKSLFWRVGNEDKFPLTYEGGAQFSSQFGGTIYNFMNNAGETYNPPVGLKGFADVFFFAGGNDSYSVYDQLNVAGNHVGSYHLSLKWNEKDWSLRGYYEHMFDDHSSMFWEYGLWKDGLVGLELQLKRFKWIDNIVVEYFNSRDQAGPIYHDATPEIPDQISAVDNYYWHYAYPCWQQYGMMLGTPLVTSCIYNSNNRFDMYNSRVEAFHLGISGNLFGDLVYKIKLTRSHNWGTYDKPFKDVKGCLSALVEVSYAPEWAKGFSVSGAFAVDDGELYGNNRGVMFGIKKSGKIF